MNTENYKASRFNRFTELDTGELVAFNAFSGGIAVMDAQTKNEYDGIVGGNVSDAIRPVTVESLEKGHFIVPRELDEVQEIQASHYLQRFVNNGLALTLIPTLDCNFACSYCFEPGRNGRPKTAECGESMGTEIQDRLLHFVESRGKENSALSVHWYGGEPLLKIDLITSLTSKFLNVCERKAIHYNSSIVTNGYLLDKEAYNRLLEAKIGSAQITLDGPPEVHNARRPHINAKSTYEEILQNVTNIPDDPRFSVAIRINADRRNIGTTYQLLEDLRARGINGRDNISIYLAMVRSMTPFCKDTDWCMHSVEFSTHEIQFYHAALAMGFRLVKLPYPCLSNCGAIGTQSIVLLPNGEVHKCWTTVGQSKFAVGTLENDGIQYRRSEFNRWLSWSPFRPACKKCDILPLCLGGCPYMTLFPDQLGQTKSPCDPLKVNLEEILKMYSISFLKRRGAAGVRSQTTT